MPNRTTGLDLTTVSIFGTDYVSWASSWNIEGEVKTQEGKAATDTDDYPVAVGRAVTMSGDLMIPSATGTTLFGTLLSAANTGSVSVNTAAGTYAGSAMLTNVRHGIEREGIQTINVTLKSLGAITVT